jgi:hypothetical protein
MANIHQHNASPTAPRRIAKWVAGVVCVCTAATTIYGLNKNPKIAILGFVGMVFAIILLLVVARATAQVGQPNAPFFDLLVRILVVFVLLYFMVFSVFLLTKLPNLFDAPPRPNAAEMEVLEHLERIEGLNAIPEKQRTNALSIARSMTEIVDFPLSLGYKIQKYEYAALGYLYAAQFETNPTERVQLAGVANRLADFALTNCIYEATGKRKFHAGPYYDKILPENMRINQDEPRIEMIRVAGTAIQAELGGKEKRAEVRSLYRNIPSDYRKTIEAEVLKDPLLGPILAETESSK